MKKITWLVGGLNVPKVGMTKIGRTISCDSSTANDLIKQGLATDGRLSKKEKEILGGK